MQHSTTEFDLLSVGLCIVGVEDHLRWQIHTVLVVEVSLHPSIHSHQPHSIDRSQSCNFVQNLPSPTWCVTTGNMCTPVYCLLPWQQCLLAGGTREFVYAVCRVWWIHCCYYQLLLHCYEVIRHVTRLCIIFWHETVADPGFQWLNSSTSSSPIFPWKTLLGNQPQAPRDEGPPGPPLTLPESLYLTLPKSLYSHFSNKVKQSKRRTNVTIAVCKFRFQK